MMSLKTPIVMKKTSPDFVRTKPERRSGVDRRKEDKGAPKGLRDRRVHVEPRQPEVQEVEISPSDWASLTNLPPPPASPPPKPKR